MILESSSLLNLRCFRAPILGPVSNSLVGAYGSCLDLSWTALGPFFVSFGFLLGALGAPWVLRGDPRAPKNIAHEFSRAPPEHPGPFLVTLGGLGPSRTHVGQNVDPSWTNVDLLTQSTICSFCLLICIPSFYYRSLLIGVGGARSVINFKHLQFI